MHKKLEYWMTRLRIMALRMRGQDIRTARYLRVRAGARLDARRGSITIGVKSLLDRGCMVLAQGGAIVIGDHVSINPYAILYGQGGLTIGNDVLIAAHAVIVPADHVFEDGTRRIRDQGLRLRGIRIGNDVWIGAGAKILDGSDIADGCVIGANAVVKGETRPYGVYVGAPARRVGDRRTTTP